MHKLLLVFYVVFCVFLSCSESPKPHKVSFCYWDREFRMDTARYANCGVNHFYIRYFDVDWDENSQTARPVASVTVTDSVPDTFTPSVFISNKVFLKLDSTGIDSLAARTSRRIRQLTESFINAAWYNRAVWNNDENARHEIEKSVSERITSILIDCDWSPQTKANYFRFIELIKAEFPDKEIEVTLRLWQYKYRDKAGIPPVNQVLLMCYNMQTANDFSVTNSIATLDELKKYVSNESYPVHVNIALPVFSWAVLFRNQQSMGLIGNADRSDYERNIIDYRKLSDNKYEVINEKVIGTFFARKGDIIRMEYVNTEELIEMAEYLQKHIRTDKDSRISFFSWNKNYLNNYKSNDLQKVTSVFNR